MLGLSGAFSWNVLLVPTRQSAEKHINNVLARAQSRDNPAKNVHAHGKETCITWCNWGERNRSYFPSSFSFFSIENKLFGIHQTSFFACWRTWVCRAENTFGVYFFPLRTFPVPSRKLGDSACNRYLPKKGDSVTENKQGIQWMKAFGRDFYRKDNPMKRFSPCNASLDSDKWNLMRNALPKNQRLTKSRQAPQQRLALNHPTKKCPNQTPNPWDICFRLRRADIEVQAVMNSFRSSDSHRANPACKTKEGNRLEQRTMTDPFLECLLTCPITGGAPQAIKKTLMVSENSRMAKTKMDMEQQQQQQQQQQQLRWAKSANANC